MRLDRALVARGFFRSRTEAQRAIDGGAVTVAGVIASKPSMKVTENDRIDAEPQRYVSRGARKLLGALDHFSPQGLVVADAECADLGASTGGFTQVLLERGARRVIAVDVGTDQLSPELVGDPRVESREQTNIRAEDSRREGDKVALVTADLSFISLTVVMPQMLQWLIPDGDFLVLVKPQFEVGRERLGKGGVVRDLEHRISAISSVARAVHNEGAQIYGIVRSMVPGPHGNVEFFLWGALSGESGTLVHEPRRRPQPLSDDALDEAIRKEVVRT